MSSVSCDTCGHTMSYQPRANVIIFCPHCLRFLHMECEYGFGPVVPCSVLLGADEYGIVTKEGHRYCLCVKANDERIALEHTYLEALDEAIGIVSDKLKRG